MNPETIEWIGEALSRLGIDRVSLASEESGRIITFAKEAFVIGNPRAWWMSLKGEQELYDSKSHKLVDILPSNDIRCWFVPETEDDGCFVYDLTGFEIQDVLNDCPFFEYYVIEKNNQWLVAESDHNQFHLVRRRGSSRL